MRRKQAPEPAPRLRTSLRPHRPRLLRERLRQQRMLRPPRHELHLHPRRRLQHRPPVEPHARPRVLRSQAHRLDARHAIRPHLRDDVRDIRMPVPHPDIHLTSRPAPAPADKPASASTSSAAEAPPRLSRQARSRHSDAAAPPPPHAAAPARPSPCSDTPPSRQEHPASHAPATTPLSFIEYPLPFTAHAPAYADASAPSPTPPPGSHASTGVPGTMP